MSRNKNNCSKDSAYLISVVRSVSLILILINNAVPTVSSSETTTITEAIVNVGAVAIVGGVVGGVFGVIIIIIIIVVAIVGIVLCTRLRKWGSVDLEGTDSTER